MDAALNISAGMHWATSGFYVCYHGDAPPFLLLLGSAGLLMSQAGCHLLTLTVTHSQDSVGLMEGCMVLPADGALCPPAAG